MSTRNSKTSWSSGNKSNGWMAFVLKEKGEFGSQDTTGNDSYPLLPSAFKSSGNVPKSNGYLQRSFCSAISNSLNVPPGFTSQKELIDLKVDTDGSSAVEKLKSHHPWADINLIQDVITATNGNVDESLALLTEMGDSNFQGLSEVETLEIDHSLQVLSEDSDTVLNSLKAVPVEPEWEEDDLYVTQRKTAIQAMRAASHHSKAAKNAFLKGDHISARYQSLKAQEQWSTAEKLNAHASSNILTIRNRTNDTWTLDLHGLHKAEATHFLLEHLNEIEKQFNLEKPVPGEESSTRASSLAHLFSQSMELADTRKCFSASRMQLRPLQVITGVGNHGNGEATLLPAVKVSLHANGYHYDEKRPGLLCVWPKYRRIPKR